MNVWIVFNPNNVLFSISNTFRQLFLLLCHLFPTPRVKYFRYLVSSVVVVCVAESSVPVLALPPIQYSCDPTAADLVLMVVRRCRCRAPPGDPGRHLGEPSGPSGDWSSSSIWGESDWGSSIWGGQPPSTCQCTPLPTHQGTHTLNS